MEETDKPTDPCVYLFVQERRGEVSEEKKKEEEEERWAPLERIEWSPGRVEEKKKKPNNFIETIGHDEEVLRR